MASLRNKGETRNQALRRWEGKHHDKPPKYTRKGRAKWYPVECEHGYDCCPMCDGQMYDPATLKPANQ